MPSSCTEASDIETLRAKLTFLGWKTAKLVLSGGSIWFVVPINKDSVVALNAALARPPQRTEEAAIREFIDGYRNYRKLAR